MWNVTLLESTKTKDEMDPSHIPTIRQLGGEVLDVRRLVYPDNKNWSCTNMSIGYAPKKGYAATFRSSNYVIAPNGVYQVVDGQAHIKAKVWFSELDKDFKPKDLRLIDFSPVEEKLGFEFRRGAEDPKLFYRDGAWHFTCVVMESPAVPYARVGVAKLDSKGTKVVDFKLYSGLDTQRPEKNWMVPYEASPKFDFIYGPNQIIVGAVLNSWMTDNPTVSQLRGGSNLHDLGDGTYLAVCHRTFIKTQAKFIPESFGTYNVQQRDYIHYFVRYDEEGYIQAVSDGFKFYKPGVEFAAGLAPYKKDLLISFGREDVSCHVARISLETVMKSLKPVEY